MRYNPEILDDIMTDAMHGFSLLEIAVRLGIPYEIFFADYKNETLQVKRYYDAGRSKGKIETDSVLYNLAKNGSATAKQAYDKKMIDAELSNKFLEILNS